MRREKPDVDPENSLPLTTRIIFMDPLLAQLLVILAAILVLSVTSRS